ncbi:hypothetical protein DPMN_023223 [Dreissena polymorpha]|uniref:Uncharacterized protein n=1 Tax=Dreissena polymorpha TaxID=45954 RepID=A0A9D4RBK0_DREPO|nr:hypothetical protein DPMN_023223 [Dreissena polymorpha]
MEARAGEAIKKISNASSNKAAIDAMRKKWTHNGRRFDFPVLSHKQEDLVNVFSTQPDDDAPDDVEAL